MATRPSIIKLADDIPFWNILLYADSGTGKTVFAGSDEKVLFLAPEDSGTLSALRTGSEASKISVRKWEDIKNAYEWFDANPDELREYDVLVIDSLSEMQYMAKEYVLRMTAPDKIRKDQDPDKMQLQDYGMFHELVEQMVRGFNDLPVNILWTATAKKVEDADGNAFLVPEIQGKGDYGFSMKMVSLMTSYGYMRTELHEIPSPTDEEPRKTKTVKRRVIYWEDTGTIRGKDRTCALAPFTINATLAQVRQAINGELKRDRSGRIVPPVATVRVKAPRKSEVEKPVEKPIEKRRQTVRNDESVPVNNDAQELEEMEDDLDIIEA